MEPPAVDGGAATDGLAVVPLVPQAARNAATPASAVPWRNRRRVRSTLSGLGGAAMRVSSSVARAVLRPGLRWPAPRGRWVALDRPPQEGPRSCDRATMSAGPGR